MRPKWWAAILAAVIVLSIALDDTQHLGPLGIVYRIPYGDKAAHFTAFGLLSLFLNLAAFEAWPRVARLLLTVRVSGGLAVLLALEELSQVLFPWRTASLWDLAAGYLGVALFAWLALRIATRRPPASSVRP